MKLAIVIATLLAVALAFFLLSRNRTSLGSSQPAPTDADVIEQLRLAGSDLSKPHNVEFFLYFPSEANASHVATELINRGYQTDVRLGQGTTQYLLLATKSMVPTTSGLVRIRQEFEALASAGGGEYDGWGTPIVR